MLSSWSCASAMERPGLTRATANTKFWPPVSGTHTCVSGSGKRNVGGITPTITWGRWSSVTVVPSTAGFDASLVAQNRWLTSATASAPDTVSAASKPRPSIGETPRKSSASAESTASAHELTVGLRQLHAPAAEMRRALQNLGLLAPGVHLVRRNRRSDRLARRAGVDDVPEIRESFGIAVGQRPEHGRVGDTEDGGIRPDAEREREHRDAREARRAAQGANAVPDVLDELVDRREPPGVPPLLGDRERIAKIALRRALRRVPPHAPTDTIFDVHLAMGLQLRVQVFLELAPAKQRRGPRDHHTQPTHQSLPASTRSISADVRRQSSVALTSCLRPATVRA